MGDGATVSPSEDAELPGHTLVLGGGRVIETRYADPLDLLRLHCAQRLGMTVVRSREVFAAWDGKGTLTIADERDLDAEFATHRLQAALADRHGLRRFMGPTREHRTYYDSLPGEALGTGGPKGMAGQAKGANEAIRAAAQAGWERAKSAPWSEPLEDTLAATVALARLLGAAAPEGSLWRGQGQGR